MSDFIMKSNVFTKLTLVKDFLHIFTWAITHIFTTVFNLYKAEESLETEDYTVRVKGHNL